MTDNLGRIFEIRPACRSDLSAMTEIYNKAIRSRYCTGHLEEFSETDREEWFHEHSNKRYPLYVAEMEGGVIGYVHISPYIKRQAYDDTCEITYYLDFDYHGRGIGSALVEYILDKARKNGFRTVIGLICSINQQSIGLLKKFGFKLWGTVPDVMDMGHGNIYSLVIYGLKL
ncbi:MAG: N-acetyltransferase [Clostridia bacterium]|nr:N-acetyltransferase [Clostridia bacterium]